MRAGGVGGTRAGAGRLGSVAGASGLALLLLVGLAGCGPDEEAPESHSEPTAPDGAAGDEEGSTTTTGPERADTPPTSYAPDTVEGEIEAAYLSSVTAFQQAIIQQEPELLGAWYSGGALETLRAQVIGVIESGESASFNRSFNLTAALVDEDVGSVTDVYENHSVTIDRDTGEPTEADPNESVLATITLRMEAGTWKVTELVIDSQPLD